MVTNLLPVLAVVWTLAKHAFIGDHAHREVVDCDAVVLPAHDLWSHVARRARCILRVLWVPQPRNAEIGHAHVAIHVEDKILWFDISVQNGVLVQILQAQ